MGKRYLIDTNILIHYFTDSIPDRIISKMTDVFKTSFNISVISQMEFLGWNKYTGESFNQAKTFIDYAHIFYLEKHIVDKTIDLKRA